MFDSGQDGWSPQEVVVERRVIRFPSERSLRPDLDRARPRVGRSLFFRCAIVSVRGLYRDVEHLPARVESRIQFRPIGEAGRVYRRDVSVVARRPTRMALIRIAI